MRTESEDLSGLDAVNPKYVLRNWVAETAIRAVEDRGDVATLDRIFKLIQSPFEKHDGDEAFAAPPPPESVRSGSELFVLTYQVTAT